ncbi:MULTISPECIES: TetR/AcrR family transcriptional regulator [Rhizobium]|jgi:AcrR family transcriptional regulator|uniref:AcrR family transcriptional regulator n=1 Tax=Rhizobium wenxiniae TaxID=1737357 RepID=A0A7W9Y4I9_9HYPH|nr:TetR/AcrR family transcriptional regulator [Rhizobium wenxiniae]MBB6161850.1 AcrR family transcriptional regulator [Rhizobium wenxiniae]GGF79553.1 TetR family transcriptional regulator [Rhizobium wenxiniae]
MLQIPEMTAQQNQPLRPRNRANTERAIFLAARDLLSEHGFQGFGINAVARRAGCDKQLIYRYYGGLDGLLDAIGEELGSWVSDKIPQDTGGMFVLTYGDLMEKLSMYFMEALRDDPLVCKIVAWEVSQDTPQVRRLSESRMKALGKWLERMQGNLKPPKGVDTATTNALLFASIQHLVISASVSGQFAGVPLKTEKDWEKVAAAVRRLVRAIYG